MSDKEHSSLSIVNWNVEWRRPRSRAADTIRRRIFEHAPDVICLTEADVDFLSASDGHVIDADPDYGYSSPPARRKVVLWSKHRWSSVDRLGDAALPGGRFVSGTTETPLGAVRFIGVCMPWPAAHVTTGRRDRARWEDHLAFLRGLSRVLDGVTERTVLLGDFNQAVPRRTAPESVFAALDQAVLSRLRIATAGSLPPRGEFLIDHVAHSLDLHSTDVCAVSNEGQSCERLSDHLGVHLRLRARRPELTIDASAIPFPRSRSQSD